MPRPALATTDDDRVPPILDDEQVLGYQAQIDQVVRMLKTKKEDFARYEKQTVSLLERARLAQPPATGAGGRNWLMRIPKLILHHRQVVQTTKKQLASLMRELSCKRNANIVLHKTLRRPRGKIRGTNTNIVAPVRFCAAYISSLSSQRRRLLRMFQSTAFHRFGLLPRAQFDCQLLRKRPRTHLKKPNCARTGDYFGNSSGFRG